MEKTTYTKADCLTPSQAAKKYKLDKDKMLRVMKKLYLTRVKVPGKPLKNVVEANQRTHHKDAFIASGEPDAMKIILQEYENMFGR